jgi:hypothetical protein
VFPGLVNEKVFDKMMNEFSYIWDEPKRYFTLDEMKDIYTFAASVPGYSGVDKVPGEVALKVEDYANAVLERRREYLAHLRASGQDTSDIELRAREALKDDGALKKVSARLPSVMQEPTPPPSDGPGAVGGLPSPTGSS